MDSSKLPDLLIAIENMSTALADAAHDIGSSLTCVEADAVAEVMVLVGREEDAKSWLNGHAIGDDCGDSHHFGPDYQQGCECTPEDVAEHDYLHPVCTVEDYVEGFKR